MGQSLGGVLPIMAGSETPGTAPRGVAETPRQLLPADEGCDTRFLTADATDWPRHWYERRGFSAVGRLHCFERG
ncbi:hypothetical protein GT025_13460 [Streptomyces sp. SID4920]|nr:hypothetical protein [Streptomyces sp. SID4920]MYX65107.1 hypothetical protein [Streptomyces sp. SID8373]